jgi:protein phosphatase
MATTLTAAALTPDGRLAVAHVGDSRGYLLRDGRLVQLTHDQTLVQALLDAGTITAAEARAHPLRSVVLAALHGRADDTAHVVVTLHELRAGDRLLLCSDGLTGVVTPATLTRILTEEHRPADTVARLLRASLAAGTRDNVTAVVADIAVVGSLRPAWPTVVGAAAPNRSAATTMPVG